MSKKLIEADLFVEDENGLHLSGSKCNQCGEMFFPKRKYCAKCMQATTKKVALPDEGVLFSFAKIYQRPPGKKGEVPYVVGKVDLPGGCRIQTIIKEPKEVPLKIGMRVKLAVLPLYKDEEDNEQIFCHMYESI